MLSKKALAALKKAEKRRTRRPVPSVAPPAKLTAPAKMENRMMSYAPDVLQNIEFALVTAYRECDGIDDAVVAATLRAAIRGESPDDPLVQAVMQVLDGICRSRPDVSDELWTDGLRVVYSSVCRHSERKTGDVDYLEFVVPFLP